ncbi:MAG: hypothetical protein HN472_00410 [Nitrospina sp.]|nr:hypothetical protein [Nitrospina sp.]MBT3876515.1 hypothetical protein [Nitrospina sp.]MBT4049534.1 hypothetical protein [Nitrospina sp.]MBT4557018.1 hypothetical protein [Nitrospina sp.]MBT5348633.1 hypothetical protein [Nitrospina sp.]
MKISFSEIGIAQVNAIEVNAIKIGLYVRIAISPDIPSRYGTLEKCNLFPVRHLI